MSQPIASGAFPYESQIPPEARVDWGTVYGLGSLEELATERDALRGFFVAQSKPQFMKRFAAGEFVVVGQMGKFQLGDVARLEVSSTSVDSKDAGGMVRKVILSPAEFPELYVIKSKLNWLEDRISLLESEQSRQFALQKRVEANGLVESK